MTKQSSAKHHVKSVKVVTMFGELYYMFRIAKGFLLKKHGEPNFESLTTKLKQNVSKQGTESAIRIPNKETVGSISIFSKSTFRPQRIVASYESSSSSLVGYLHNSANNHIPNPMK